VKVAIALGAVAVTVISGCAGGDRQEHRFTAADALHIAAVRPVAPGWHWPPNPAKPDWSDSQAEPPSTDPVLAEFRHEKAGLVSAGDADKRWQDADKLGNLDVALYGSAADAHQALRPFDALSRKLAARSGRVVAAGPVDGIGDEAWRLLVAGNGPQVTYHWRRGNLLVEAHLHCFGSCPPDVDAAARSWAQKIDAAARARS
jgi:hypothetical protein